MCTACVRINLHLCATPTLSVWACLTLMYELRIQEAVGAFVKKKT